MANDFTPPVRLVASNEAPRETHNEPALLPLPEGQPRISPEPRKDHFVFHHGVLCSGRHFIVDLFDATRLDDLRHMECSMREAVAKANATLLHIHVHRFSPSGGLSGVAVLAESHISVHTWPENDYAAFDIFMCGDTEPEQAVEVIKNAFAPKRVDVRELLRGIVEGD